MAKHIKVKKPVVHLSKSAKIASTMYDIHTGVSAKTIMRMMGLAEHNCKIAREKMRKTSSEVAVVDEPVAEKAAA